MSKFKEMICPFSVPLYLPLALGDREDLVGPINRTKSQTKLNKLKINKPTFFNVTGTNLSQGLQVIPLLS